MVYNMKYNLPKLFFGDPIEDIRVTLKGDAEV